MQLGILANWRQFVLLTVVNAFVGSMVGLERSLLPLLAHDVFGLAAAASAVSFVAAFGLVKATTNLFAGKAAERYGRKPILIAGWLLALPVPLMLAWAPAWGWVVAANVLLGASQGLTWSITVIMKIDIVGPARRGLAMGLNEFAGYLAVAAVAVATGFLAAELGLRPYPFLLGLVFALIGLLLSVFAVRETLGFVRHEAGEEPDARRPRSVFTHTSFKHRSLSAITQAGFVNNLNDGVAWGLFPLLFAARGFTLGKIGALAGLYPAVWGVTQLVAGPLSDRIGRRIPIVAGMVLQAAALGLVARAETMSLLTAALVILGVGTGLVYPTLLAAIGDLTHPTWRAQAVGAYRFWRDMGYAAGAMLAGIIGSFFGLQAAVYAVAALTFFSGVYALRIRAISAAPRLPRSYPSRNPSRA